MIQPRLCIHTQTPLVRFTEGVRAPPGAPLARFREGVDYLRSPGGVTRMIEPLVRRLTRLGRVREATWMSLARAGPISVGLTPKVTLQQVRLSRDDLAAYTAAKEELWSALHGLPGAGLSRGAVEDGLDRLARAMARRTAALHERRPYDAFYVHDFQLLPLGRRLPAGPPRVFRWHIPVPDGPFPFRESVVGFLNDYDAVIVSTAAYARRMRRAGVTVPVHACYPYLDETRGRVVTSDDLRAFDARFGLAPEDVVFLVVARLDPMKSQDVAIRALARIAEEVPRAKLVLVGGGGFSAGRGGLGLGKADGWRGELERLARDLGVADRVVFTGGIPDDDLDVAYTRARAVLLPSTIEGFGLAVVEGWLYGRPVVVSRGAGVAELVQSGRNGYSFDAGDADALADAMARLGLDAAHARELGREGRATARACQLARGSDAAWSVVAGAIARRAGGRPL